MHTIIYLLLIIQAWIASAAHDDPTTPYPNITITTWTDSTCGPPRKAGHPPDLHKGYSLYMDPVAENYVIGESDASSYWLSRDLINDERLDWSQCADLGCETVGDVKGECTQFLFRTSPDSNGEALLALTCYPLSARAQVSRRS